MEFAAFLQYGAFGLLSLILIGLAYFTSRHLWPLFERLIDKQTDSVKALGSIDEHLSKMLAQSEAQTKLLQALVENQRIDRERTSAILKKVSHNLETGVRSHDATSGRNISSASAEPRSHLDRESGAGSSIL